MILVAVAAVVVILRRSEDSTVSVYDPSTGETVSIETGVDDPQLIQRGEFAVALGRGENAGLTLVDLGSRRVTDLGRVDGYDDQDPFDWYEYLGAPVLVLNESDGTTVFVHPRTGNRVSVGGGPWSVGTATGLADGRRVTARRALDDVSVVVDLTREETLTLSGAIVAMSDEIIVTSERGELGFYDAAGDPLPIHVDDVDERAIAPLRDAVVYVDTSGRVMQSSIDGTPPTELATIPPNGEPTVVSVADPERLVVESKMGIIIVDPDQGVIRTFDEQRTRLLELMKLSAGSSPNEWTCLPLLVDDDLLLVDPETGSTIAEPPITAGSLDETFNAPDFTFLASNGCVIALRTGGDQWFVASVDGSVTIPGTLIRVADDGTAALVHRDDEYRIVDVADPDDFFATAPGTVLSASSLGWP